MKLYTVILIIVGLFFYVLICAGIMHGIERQNEADKAVLLTKSFNDFKASKACLTPETINSILDNLHLMQISGLRLTPSGISGSSWDFPSSIFMCFQVISAVGFGASSPKTLGGKVFLIFYTFFGLGLFIATALAIASQLVVFVDWVRRKVGIRGKLRTAYFIHTFRIVLLVVIGVLVFGVIPAAIFSSIDPKFGFSQAFAVVSVGVVGYSDIMNEYDEVDPWFRLGVGVWAVMSLLWFSATFSTLRNILSAYNSDAIEIPSWCRSVHSKNKDAYSSGQNISSGPQPIDCNLNPFECNKETTDPYPSEDMIPPVVQKAVIVMGAPKDSETTNDIVQMKAQKSVIITGNPNDYRSSEVPFHPKYPTLDNNSVQPTQIYSSALPQSYPAIVPPYEQYPSNDLVNPAGQTTVIQTGNEPQNYHNAAYLENEDLVHPTSQKAVINIGNHNGYAAQPSDPSYNVLARGTTSSINIGGY